MLGRGTYCPCVVGYLKSGTNHFGTTYFVPNYLGSNRGKKKKKFSLQAYLTTFTYLLTT